MSADDRSAQQVARMIAKTFSTPDGRDALRILRRMYLTPSSYVKGDSHDTAFREGRKEPVRWIMAKMTAAKAELPEEE